jgi:hypothetical protein
LKIIFRRGFLIQERCKNLLKLAAILEKQYAELPGEYIYGTRTTNY